MNMSYCRFRNTLADLRDCSENFHDIHSPEELRAAQSLIKLAQQIAQENPDTLEVAQDDDSDDEDE